MEENFDILLVDDVDFFLEMERDLLRNTAASIRTAKNGLEALDRVSEARPDLIFLDLNMPGMDGAECCRRIKAQAQTKSIPIVMVMASKNQEDIDRCREAGCDAVLTKPVDRKLFLATGRNLLNGIERRDRRVPFRSKLTFRADFETHDGESLEISRSGIYIHTAHRVEMDDLVKVFLVLDGDPLEVRGRVAWVNQGVPRSRLGMPQGFGVEFVRMPSEVAAKISRFIENLEAR